VEARALFVDASAWIALFRSREQHHDRARALWRVASRASRVLVTTNIVVGEAHAGFVSRGSLEMGEKFLDFAFGTPALTLIWADADITFAARDRWIRRLHDKAISLADAISFETMDREGIGEAFAFDQDFVRAGFRLLK
jgi:predicted nucleic acid-binding protein